MGRFFYTTMVPPLIESGQLSELEAGYVGGFNLAAFFSAPISRSACEMPCRSDCFSPARSGSGCSRSWRPRFLPDLLARLWRAVLGAIAGLIMVQASPSPPPPLLPTSGP